MRKSTLFIAAFLLATAAFWGKTFFDQIPRTEASGAPHVERIDPTDMMHRAPHDLPHVRADLS